MRAEYALGIIILTLGALAVLFVLFGGEMTNMSIVKEPYVEIAGPAGFLNTGENPDGTAQSITIGELVGKKVILVDFMTYSCINCQRTFPYLTAWYEKYKDSGLEIVAIHTPEFAFEKNIANVRAALAEHGITYPVVLDNDYATWRAYGNNYWPRKYLIDIEGNIVYDHIGEGAYEETEMKIRELLDERATKLDEKPVADDDLVAADIPEVARSSRTQEIYFGSLRSNALANGPRDGAATYMLPAEFKVHKLYLGGRWDIAPEYAEPIGASSIIIRYRGKEVYFVARADAPTRVHVFQDGMRVSDARGEHVAADGSVTIQEDRLYKLIKNSDTGEHVLELRIPEGGLEAYTFTFG
jgi:thiol-disulfide isomerase/thioredoxin